MKTVKDYDYSFNHVNERLLERYKIKPLTKSEYGIMNQMVEALKNPEKLVWSDNNGDQEVYEWILSNKFGKYVKTKIVWSKEKQRVTTVL